MKQLWRTAAALSLALILLLSAVPVSALFAPGWDTWSESVEAAWSETYQGGEAAIRAQNILGPVNPNASQEAKNLYAYLAVVSDSEQFLTGTFDISTSNRVYNQVVQEYGLEPALYSNRYIVDTSEPAFAVDENGSTVIAADNPCTDFINVAAANEKLREHYENGNVLLVHSDSEVPNVAGKHAADLGLYEMSASGAVANAIQELDRTNPDRNMEVYAIWQKFMNNEIAALRSLEEDYGVKAYLWRPWIELNYKPFNGETEEAHAAFTRVFQQNVEAMIDAGLTGFLVTYSPGSSTNTITRYPGNDYVDVLSATMYSYATDLGALKSDWFDNYRWYAHAGKPIGFSELSCRTGDWKKQGGDPRASWYDLLQDMIRYWPGVSWVNCWSDGSYSLIDSDFSGNGNDDGKLFMDSPYSLDLSEVLDYRHGELQAPGVAQLFTTQDAGGSYLSLEERVYTEAALQEQGFCVADLRALHLNRNFKITFYTGTDGASGTAKSFDVGGKGITAAEMAGYRSCAVTYREEDTNAEVDGASYYPVTALEQLPENSGNTYDCNYASLIRGRRAYNGVSAGNVLNAVGGSNAASQTDGKYQGLDETVRYRTTSTQTSVTINGTTYRSEAVPENSYGYSGYWSYTAGGWVNTDANETRTVFYANTDTEWGPGVKLYYDMGSEKSIGSLIIGSTTDITAWKIGNLSGTVPTDETMIRYWSQGYGQHSYLYAGKVYVGNDPTTLYSEANLVMQYDWAQSWASMKRALRNLYTLENTATGRYVGFVFPALENQVRISELAVYGAHQVTETVVPSTCTSNGAVIKLCSECGAKYEEILYATGHQYESVEYRLATCTEDGISTHRCTVCGNTYSTVFVAPGHDDAVTEAVQPTCEQDGYIVYTCRTCQRVLRQELPKLGHQYSHTIEKEPDGSYTVTTTCARCGDTTILYVPASSRDNETEFGDWDLCGGQHTYVSAVTKEATCAEAGEMTYLCTVCGDTYTEPIKALGHNWSKEWTVDVEPTTTTEGSQSHHCTRCDEKTDVTVIPKLITGWYTNEETGLVYYYNADGTMNTETRISVDGKWCNFYPANSIVDGVDVSYSYLIGWKKMPSKITRYYPEGAYWFHTGFQTVDGNKYFFNKTSGALYIPPANEVLYGVGWYIESGAYYALDPATGAWIRGLYTDKNGDTYYFTKYDTNACYTTGLVKDNGNTYYFDPATGKRVENETCVVGAATLTFDENGVLVKKVGLYEGYLYGENGDPAPGQLIYGADGMLYRATTGGKLDAYYVRKDPRDSSKNIYILNGKVLEGLVTITEADLKSTYAKTEFPEITVAGVYLFEGNTKTYVKGFGKAPNGLEYFFRPGNGTRYEPSATYAQLTMVDGSKQIVNFYKKGTIVDGVDYSFVHKVGLVTENGNLYYYEDGTAGCVKGQTVTVDGVQYALDADTGVATIVE